MRSVLVLTGALSGLLVGYVLQRSQLCFHATWAGIFERRLHLFRAWILAVAVLMVGLTVLLPLDDDLNRGLPFDPVHNIVGGLLMGAGMTVALSCASGLFFKLGAGMFGAAVGLVGWAFGEAVVRDVTLPGSGTALAGGDDATFAGVLNVPRAVVALPVAVRHRRRPGAATRSRQLLSDRGSGGGLSPGWRWGAPAWPRGFWRAWPATPSVRRPWGPSPPSPTVVRATPRWLIAFLVALVPGACFAAGASGGLWVRGETGRRYVGPRARRRAARRRCEHRRRLQPRPRPVGCRPAQRVLLGGRHQHHRRHRRGAHGATE